MKITITTPPLDELNAAHFTISELLKRAIAAYRLRGKELFRIDDKERGKELTIEKDDKVRGIKIVIERA